MGLKMTNVNKHTNTFNVVNRTTVQTLLNDIITDSVFIYDESYINNMVSLWQYCNLEQRSLLIRYIDTTIKVTNQHIHSTKLTTRDTGIPTDLATLLKGSLPPVIDNDSVSISNYLKLGTNLRYIFISLLVRYKRLASKPKKVNSEHVINLLLLRRTIRSLNPNTVLSLASTHIKDNLISYDSALSYSNNIPNICRTVIALSRINTICSSDWLADIMFKIIILNSDSNSEILTNMASILYKIIALPVMFRLGDDDMVDVNEIFDYNKFISDKTPLDLLVMARDAIKVINETYKSDSIDKDIFLKIVTSIDHKLNTFSSLKK